eukprot:TRINITY_DN3058_c0_g1_i2.p2 TRINITY_DN3058_c0_g1~~TRINITY_DN3058_c0_g1_i2.p2  ORF type:complete len:120 (+),score=29.96 TRINITY_DN3058_c0_g1_i2:419-778(+)
MQAEDIELRVLGSDRKFLESIVLGAMKTYYVKMATKVAVYVPNSGWPNVWTISAYRTPRSLDSVLLDEGIAERIIGDVQKFSVSESWYNQLAFLIEEDTCCMDLPEPARHPSCWLWLDI